MKRLLPYARLMRLPNVFTAMADISLGASATIALSPSQVDVWSGLSIAFLMLASACLYTSGMVWNDWFDWEEDRRERPYRPLPAGKVSMETALRLAVGLMVAGVVFASCAGWDDSHFRIEPTLISLALVGAILAYDARLKRTVVGPLAMALCRFLNVLLGLSLLPSETLELGLRIHLATTVGVYIIGVTWFARSEATQSNSYQLIAAMVVVLASLLLALAVPLWFAEGQVGIAFPYLLIGFAAWISSPMLRAIQQPSPDFVQRAVKRTIMGLIVLDSILATAFLGTLGLLILLWLLPALWLGKWMYST